MNFDVTEERGVILIILNGEMVGGPDATALSEKLHDLITDNKKKIMLDMSEVRWMNSSGLGILIGALNTIRKADGNLKLFGLTDKPRHLLKITQLDKVFDICQTKEEAIDQFV
ncbi:STAS domain-containing protein [bacterium]|nr:STAS domain-containing protein [bacterium]RQV98216.1 MAG: anti-sigma factor antagonist [bacterium]